MANKTFWADVNDSDEVPVDTAELSVTSTSPTATWAAAGSARADSSRRLRPLPRPRGPRSANARKGRYYRIADTPHLLYCKPKGTAFVSTKFPQRLKAMNKGLNVASSIEDEFGLHHRGTSGLVLQMRKLRRLPLPSNRFELLTLRSIASSHRPKPRARHAVQRRLPNQAKITNRTFALPHRMQRTARRRKLLMPPT